MNFFSQTQKRALAALCETFAPALAADGDDAALMGASSRDVGLADALETGLLRVMDDSQRRELTLFLTMIEQGAFNGVTAGAWRGFSALSLPERERVLRAWALSDVPKARMTFQALKRLSLFLFYSLVRDDQRNPTWGALHYPGGVGAQAAAPRPITPLAITGDTTLTADVLIIGSGAGGGVVAGELTAAGYDVIVVEKGDYYAESDFDGRELTATERMFESYGALTTRDLGMVILAGSTLGGGTTVNWSASFRTPDDVLHEWARDYGFSAASSADFQSSLDAVCTRINVTTPAACNNPLNNALADGCRALGYAIKPIPRNVQGCEDCGFCNFGCAFGAKQGTLKTYLQDAHLRGARIIVRGYVERITQSAGSATGAEVRVTDADGRQHSVTIRAKIVVAAAGALHTPPLLRRSGLHNPNIGANLHLHPTTVVYGLFDHAIRGWQGVPMGMVSTEFANLDGTGYGARLETAPIHPGIAALTLPWVAARQHRRLMGKLEHLANIIILARDRGSGRVTADKQGRLRIEYQLAAGDAAHLVRGMEAALRVHVAAGAREVCSPHSDYNPYHPQDGDPAALEAYLRQTAARRLRTNSFALFSAHQMSSCRIGKDAAQGALDPTGQTYEVRNLYVADGSVMPTATGVNPMISIMATAHHIAHGIKDF
jgi:choline dehydrogenase-like flavoprotein